MYTVVMETSALTRPKIKCQSIFTVFIRKLSVKVLLLMEKKYYPCVWQTLRINVNITCLFTIKLHRAMFEFLGLHQNP